MPTQTLRWGLLSTARINKALIPPLLLSKRNKLVAVASRSQKKADAFAKEKKIKRAFGSYEAMLADPEIDVIYNPLPNHMHAEWTIRALEAGKHVLCEKPLALSLAEVDAISAAVQRSGKIAAEAFAYRSHPQTQQIKEFINSGKLGRVRLVHGSFSFALGDPSDIRWDPKMGGGGLWDIGCYPISFARWVLGTEPLEVYGWQVTSPSGVDATFAGQLRFPGDIYFQLDSSFEIPSHQFVDIVGDEGTLSIPQPFNASLKRSLFLTRGEKTTTIPVKGLDPYACQVEDFADSVLLGKPPVVSLADSRLNTATILALLESARTNKPVSM